MLVRVAGDNIMMSPPFIMTPEEVDEVHSNSLLNNVVIVGLGARCPQAEGIFPLGAT